LWAEEPQPDTETDQETSFFDAMSLAQHACADMQHKSFFGLFVPHIRLFQIMAELKLVPSGALRLSKLKLSNFSNKRHRQK
jgi:hypothetical protein